LGGGRPLHAFLYLLVACCHAGLHRSSRTGSPVVLPDTEGKYWSSLSPAEQKGATLLGYNQKMWDNNELPVSDNKRWKELTNQERHGAHKLGYQGKLWNKELDARDQIPAGGQRVRDLINSADFVTKQIGQHRVAAKVPPGQWKIHDLVDAADSITAAINDHLTDHKARDDPSSPEEHDKQMENEMHSHRDDPDSPEAHDARMQAEIDAHKSDAEKHKRAEIDERLKRDSKMDPEAAIIVQQARAVMESVPESSPSWKRAKEVFNEIEATLKVQSDHGSNLPAKVPDHYHPIIKQPGGVPMPMEEPGTAPPAEPHMDPSLSKVKVSDSYSALTNAATALQKDLHQDLAKRKNTVEDIRTRYEKDAQFRTHVKTQLDAISKLVRKITQFTDDRKPLLSGNKRMISKINNFFGDSSAQASRGALLNPSMPPSPVEVAFQNVAKAYTGKPFTNAEAAAAEVPSAERHTAGDDGLNQGEQHTTPHGIGLAGHVQSSILQKIGDKA